MKTIDFLKFRHVALVLSWTFIIGGIAITMLRGGFNFGVDFQAGINQVVQINSDQATPERVRAALADIEGIQVQSVGTAESRQFSLRVKEDKDVPDFEKIVSESLAGKLQAAFGAESLNVLRTDYVGPRFSSGLVSQSIWLAFMTVSIILIYCWFRFKLAYALGAVVATLHDPLFMIAAIGLFQIEVSTATIAAILTIVGYSLNDTIVIFDRVRENVTLMKGTRFRDIINASITQTLSRTFITSFTTLLAVVALFVFTSGEVQRFSLAMIIGIVVGTYSTIFIASPVLKWWTDFETRRKAKKEARISGKPVEEVLKAVEGEALDAPAQDTETPDEDVAPSADAAARKALPPRKSREARKRTGKK